MKKEMIICIIILITIVTSNILTQKYTKQSVDSLSNDLQELRTKILEKMDRQEETKQELINGSKKIMENWKSRHDNLAYYIEHDELEKVENSFTSIESSVNTENYDETVLEIDKSIFLLKHIEEKYAFNLENIF